MCHSSTKEVVFLWDIDNQPEYVCYIVIFVAGHSLSIHTCTMYCVRQPTALGMKHRRPVLSDPNLNKKYFIFRIVKS